MKYFKQVIKASLLLIVIFFSVGIFNSADAYVSVKGYYRKNGTYVAPHVRSDPNGLKYDNYGYKPSQGLYNKTYGTKGAEWDTPTYITDPYYYQGKSIYDYNQGYSSSSLNDFKASPYYTPTYKPVTSTLPTYSSQYTPTVYNSSAVTQTPEIETKTCSRGTYFNAGRCDDIILPPNAYISGNKWVCNFGYTVSSDKLGCTQIIVPPNGHVVDSTLGSWDCDFGYYLNDTKTGCNHIVFPAGAHATGNTAGSWACNYSFTVGPDQRSCIRR